MATDWSVALNLNDTSMIHVADIRVVETTTSLLCISGHAYDRSMRPITDESFLGLIKASTDNLQKINGCFAGMFVEQDKATLFTDRVMGGKLYYSIYNNWLYISNSILRIIKECPCEFSINLDALCEMFKWNCLLSNHTLYQNVFNMKPGRVAILHRSSKIINWYHYDSVLERGILDDRPIRIIAKDLVEKLSTCIENAYTNCGGIGATITGGLDSRLLLGIAQKLGLTPQVFTCENDGGYDEYNMIKPLLAHWGIESRYFPIEDTDYFSMYANHYFRKANYQCLQHIWFAGSALASAENKAVINAFGNCLTGIGGGELIRFDNGNTRTSELYTHFTSKSIHSLVENINRISIGYKNYFSNEFIEAIDEIFSRSLFNSTIPYIDKPRGGADWFLNNRLYNGVLYFFHMFSDDFLGFSPFLTCEVLDILLSLPNNILTNDLLYKVLFDEVDIDLMSYSSTRNIGSGEYYRKPKIHTKETAKYVLGTALNSRLLQLNYLDESKITTYIESMIAKERIFIDYGLRAIVAASCIV